MPDETCATCQCYFPGHPPGKLYGWCTLAGMHVYPDSACEAWEERLPFADAPDSEEE